MSLSCRVSLRSGCQSLLELSIGGNCQDVLSKRSLVFRQSRVCVARSVKVSGSDKLINLVLCQVKKSGQSGQAVNTN